MKDREGENLRALLGRFVDAEQAREMGDDIENGDEILGQWRAPEPSAEVICAIKARMTARLSSGRGRLRALASRAAAIAAAVVVVAMIWTGWHGGEGGGSTTAATAFIPTAIWESDNIGMDDLRLASFSAEIERLENEVKAFLGGESGGGEFDVDEIEMDFLEMQGEFWKG